MNITYITITCMCLAVEIVKGFNNATLGTLPTKERNRRLIPYMTFYLGQPQNPQYRQVMAVPYSNLPQQPYRPVQQRYVQQPTPLTRMITQNYLTLAKHIQGNQRLITRINPTNNYQQEMKYYAPHQAQQVNIGHHQQQPIQYAKPQSTLQYIQPQDEEHYSNKNTDDYDQRDEEPQEDVDYSKPSAASLLQYVKPEVQQYVTKFAEDEKHDYDDTVPHSSPLQYVTKTNEPQRYTINEGYGKLQYVQKPQDLIHSQVQKPIFRYVTKLPGITGLKFAAQPADIPEYITKPVHKSNKDPTSVTIMQSQEIDVDALPSTQSPVPKYHATYVAKPENYFQYQHHNGQEEQEDKAEEILEPNNVDKNINDILEGVSLSKSLPEKITTENLDSSIKTLSKILRILQRAHSLPHSAKDIVRGFPKANELRTKAPVLKLQPQLKYNDGSTPGRAGVDYPVYDEIPQTHFSCKEQRYKGFFGDPETGCQVWHYCDLNGGQASFLCPNGTIFSQVALTCDWWFNVKCASTAQLYVLNERLYKYILPQKPSFPEDYSGPLVDHYLTLKFKEIEEKNKNKTEEHKEENKDEDIEPPFSIDTATQNKLRSILIN